MDAHANHSDDLNELERRLSSWKPANAGLDAEVMLFEAGRASARSGPLRFVWPMLTAGATGLVIVLGFCLLAERGERLALAQQLHRQPPAPESTPVPPPSPVVPAESPTDDEPAPNSYFATHRALAKGLDDWPERTIVRASDSPAPPSPVLSVWSRDALLDP
jgi:hypothetical protein